MSDKPASRRRWQVGLTYPDGHKTKYIPLRMHEALKVAKQEMWGGKKIVTITPVFVEPKFKRKSQSNEPPNPTAE
jgi:hypothetical protein